MMNSEQSGHKRQWDFLTHEGRLQLYYEWARLRIAEGRLSVTEEYTLEERCAFLADWLRWLIARGSLNPRKRLPPYEELAAVPLHLEKQEIAIYRRVYHAQSGWIHLTRKGIREAGLDFRAEAPSARTLDHLYWINEVRMHLEDEYDESEMQWISERDIQAEQELRQKGQKLKHIQDGILLLKDAHDEWEEIDIEVQISKPSSGEVEEVMNDQFWTNSRNRPLRYYVNRLSRGVVRSVYRKMVKERSAMRPSIEIIDLEHWQPLSLEEEE